MSRSSRLTSTICATTFLCLLLSIPATSYAEIMTTGDVSPADPATWTDTTGVNVGSTSYGSLSILNSSKVITQGASLGTGSGVYGKVIIDGVGSEWNMSEMLRVGNMNGNGELDPDEFTNIISHDPDRDRNPDKYSKWIVGRAEMDVWGDFHIEYYLDDHNCFWWLAIVTEFVVDGVKVFIGSQGTIGIEAKVYWLERWKVWYNHVCCDPWTTDPGVYQLFLDAYESGWDIIDGSNYYIYQPPGTGLWPRAGLYNWTRTVDN